MTSSHSEEFSENGKYVLTGGRDSLTRLWDIRAGKVVNIYEGANQTNKELGSCLSDDESRIYSCDESGTGTIRCWDTKTRLRLPESDLPVGSMPWCVAHSPVAPILVTGGADKTLKFFHLPKAAAGNAAAAAADDDAAAGSGQGGGGGATAADEGEASGAAEPEPEPEPEPELTEAEKIAQVMKFMNETASVAARVKKEEEPAPVAAEEKKEGAVAPGTAEGASATVNVEEENETASVAAEGKEGEVA